MDKIIMNSHGDQGVLRARVAGFETGPAHKRFVSGRGVVDNLNLDEPAVLDVVLDTGVRIHFEVATTDEELKPLVERFRKLYESKPKAAPEYQQGIYTADQMKQAYLAGANEGAE